MDIQSLLPLLPIWYLVFLLSLTCHEAGHAWAAWKGGDPTAYLGGQVSLNPIPHMQREPTGTILVPLISFFMFQGSWLIGWASAPYDPHWELRHPKRAAWMAACGPLANLILAAVGFAVLKAGIVAGWWSSLPPGSRIEISELVIPPESAGAGIQAAVHLFSILLSLNVVLFVFNLIPLPPMDGASILGNLFAGFRRARESLSAMPMGNLMGLLLAWWLFPKFFWLLFLPVLSLLWM